VFLGRLGFQSVYVWADCSTRRLFENAYGEPGPSNFHKAGLSNLAQRYMRSAALHEVELQTDWERLQAARPALPIAPSILNPCFSESCTDRFAPPTSFLGSRLVSQVPYGHARSRRIGALRQASKRSSLVNRRIGSKSSGLDGSRHRDVVHSSGAASTRQIFDDNGLSSVSARRFWSRDACVASCWRNA
jgi:hypothetical protein